MKIGLDVGSTTLKCVVLDENDKIIYKSYCRHFSQISEKTCELLEKIDSLYPQGAFSLCVSGSAGMGFAENIGIDFVQEVYATRVAVKKYFPQKVYKTVIPRNVRLSEAPSFGEPITSYDITSKGAESYLNLAIELIHKNKGM